MPWWGWLLWVVFAGPIVMLLGGAVVAGVYQIIHRGGTCVECGGATRDDVRR